MSPTNRMQTLPLLLDTNQCRSFWLHLCYLISGMAGELEAELIVFGLGPPPAAAVCWDTACLRVF